jgi:hypothetical protein
MSLKDISPRTAYVLTGVGFLLFLVLGWVLLIGPQRDEAASLDGEIEATRVLLAAPVPEPEEVLDPEVANELLTQAMPDEVGMPEVIVELNRLASEAGVRLDSIAPASPVAQPTYQQQPLNVTLQGSFFGFNDFLRRLRAEVGIVNGQVEGSGRIFGVDSITFAEGQPQFPNLTATLTISTAFAPVAPAPAAVPPAEEGTGAMPTAPAAETP